MRAQLDRLRRAERRAASRPGCACSDPDSPLFRLRVLEFSHDQVDDADPGPCPRCGAPPLRIEIVERPTNDGTIDPLKKQPLSGRRIGWR